MRFNQPLMPGRLVRRYQRFLADIELSNGSIVTAHCPNSGSMLSCNTPGSEVRLSYHENPNRKHPYTWEMIKVRSIWVGINTQIPNRLVQEAILQKKMPEFIGYREVIREPKIGAHSRLDLLLQNGDQRCFVEIKNVTLVENGVALFPDAVTARGSKHLMELMALKQQGHRAVILFLIQRYDGNYFGPASHIDPVYSAHLHEAYLNGVEVIAYRALVTPQSIELDRRIKTVFDS
ncbi:MAG: DNA/RNA nuclease SfsA [candidate division KSB1 bacterium]|nr:DNA/RNA nuclease SfsA [candidate division KSB1 bacterium]MDZ7333564.1 DNA/RNA nuclease SfsA [candidate division KSB1 bacterium]MDZ7357009.1 DNA/RNA nuclease SfsA [candidate division KSB1 bacterium]MDZ7376771.1 DNA/RNA nuclease SfsA [candidate division KSB1 bacterium]MDZ7398678.1 DNA/RNA nuclease SfsA [candidate division KSB1 bacterium]